MNCLRALFVARIVLARFFQNAAQTLLKQLKQNKFSEYNAIGFEDFF